MVLARDVSFFLMFLFFVIRRPPKSTRTDTLFPYSTLVRSAQLEAIRGDIENGLSREALQDVLPPGGARNALDCAYWDLEAKASGRRAFERAGLDRKSTRLNSSH